MGSGVVQKNQIAEAHANLDIGGLLSLLDVVADMRKVVELDGDSDDVEAHAPDVLAGSAVVPRPHIRFECLL